MPKSKGGDPKCAITSHNEMKVAGKVAAHTFKPEEPATSFSKAIALLDRQIKTANENKKRRLEQQLRGVERAIDCATAQIEALEEARAAIDSALKQ